MTNDLRDDPNHPDHDAVCGWCGRPPATPEAVFRAGYAAARRDEEKPAYAIGLDPAGDAWEEFQETPHD